jgi:hypothetical protein
MEIKSDWDKWKNALGEAVNIGETIGIPDKAIENIAEKVGTFLSQNVDPANHEERLLSELWGVANKDDRKVLAKLVVRIVDK